MTSFWEKKYSIQQGHFRLGMASPGDKSFAAYDYSSKFTSPVKLAEYLLYNNR